MTFEEHGGFAREFKQFRKRWASLDSDLLIANKVISTLYSGSGGLSADELRQAFFAEPNAAILHRPRIGCEIVKMRLDCKSLNKKTLRLVFCRCDKKIILIEIFSKSDKPREDQRRLRPYLKCTSDEL